MHSQLPRFPYVASALYLLVLISAATLAENTTPLQIEEILVTAERSQSKLQETPISISVFSAENIQASRIDNALDLALYTPGLVMGNSSGTSTPEIYIRGVGTNDFSIGADISVGFYLDDVYIGRESGVFFELFDIERIEVLRGPQGVLFGRNTIAGAVSIITKRPSEEFEATIKTGIGSYNLNQVSLAISGPVADSGLLGKLALTSKTRDGYADNVFDGREKGDEENINGRGALLLPMGTNTELLWSADFSRDRPTGIVYKTEATGGSLVFGIFDFACAPLVGGGCTVENLGHVEPSDTWDVNHDVGGFEHRDIAGTSFRLTHDIGDYQLKSITAYRKIELDLLEDTDGVSLDLITLIRQVEQDQWSEELHFSYNGDEKLSWLFGVFLYREEVENYSKADSQDVNLFLSPATGFGFSNDYSTETFDENTTTSYAVFGQLKYAFDDALTLTLGLRHTYERKEYQVLNISNEEPLCELAFCYLGATEPLQQFEDSWDQLTPKLGLDYQLDADVLLYASITEGFKSGGFDSSTGVDNKSFDQELTLAYELGVKSAWLDRTLIVNASAFYYDIDDLQVQIFVVNPTPGLITDNAATATVYGSEIELVAKPIENLDLIASVALLNAEYDDFPFDLPAGIDYSGNTMKRAPEYTYSLIAQYRTHLNGAGWLSTRLEYQYQSTIYFTESQDQSLSQSDYDNINASIGWESMDEHWTTSIYVRNLTDQESVSAANDLGDILGLIARAYNPPRTYGLEFQYDF